MRLPEDDFVAGIVVDPNTPPDTILVVGFVGRADTGDDTRIYLDVMLSSYLEVQDSKILHAQRIPASQSPLGGWYIWLRRDLDLVEVVRAAYARLEEVQQDFVRNLRRTEDSFTDIQPGWPQMPG